jgi:hypothetical protein
VDRGVGAIGITARDLELVIRHVEPKAVLAESQFVAGAQSARSAGIEARGLGVAQLPAQLLVMLEATAVD